MKKIYLLIIAGMFPALSFAQNYTDGLMMPKGDFCTGAMYSHDYWKKYYVGGDEYQNGNMDLTTQMWMWIGTYGLNSRVNLLSTLVYGSTSSGPGTIAGQQGLQDLSLGVKYNFFRYKFAKSQLKTFATFNVSFPTTDYVVDYLPFAIGSGSTRLQYRFTAYYRMENGIFVNASPGYTWRSNITMDRPTHMEGGHLVNSSEAFLSNQFDLFVSAGYHKGPIQAELNYMQLNTLGGSDIVTVTMPEVGARMNFIKAGATVMYYLPKPQGLALRAAFAHTFDGRNVGISNTFTGGILYTIHFIKKTTELTNEQ